MASKFGTSNFQNMGSFGAPSSGGDNSGAQQQEELRAPSVSFDDLGSEEQKVYMDEFYNVYDEEKDNKLEATFAAEDKLFSWQASKREPVAALDDPLGIGTVPGDRLTSTVEGQAQINRDTTPSIIFDNLNGEDQKVYMDAYYSVYDEQKDNKPEATFAAENAIRAKYVNLTDNLLDDDTLDTLMGWEPGTAGNLTEDTKAAMRLVWQEYGKNGLDKYMNGGTVEDRRYAPQDSRWREAEQMIGPAHGQQVRAEAGISDDWETLGVPQKADRGRNPGDVLDKYYTALGVPGYEAGGEDPDLEAVYQRVNQIEDEDLRNAVGSSITAMNNAFKYGGTDKAMVDSAYNTLAMLEEYEDRREQVFSEYEQNEERISQEAANVFADDGFARAARNIQFTEDDYKSLTDEARKEALDYYRDHGDLDDWYIYDEETGEIREDMLRSTERPQVTWDRTVQEEAQERRDEANSSATNAAQSVWDVVSRIPSGLQEELVGNSFAIAKAMAGGTNVNPVYGQNVEWLHEQSKPIADAYQTTKNAIFDVTGVAAEGVTEGLVGAAQKGVNFVRGAYDLAQLDLIYDINPYMQTASDWLQGVQEGLRKEGDMYKEQVRPQIEGLVESLGVSKEDAAAFTETLLTDVLQSGAVNYGNMLPSTIAMVLSGGATAAAELSGKKGIPLIMEKIVSTVKSPGFFQIFVNEAGSHIQEAYEKHGDQTTDFDLTAAMMGGFASSIVEIYETKLFGSGLQSLVMRGGAVGAKQFAAGVIQEVYEENFQHLIQYGFEDLGDLMSGRPISHALDTTTEDSLFNVAAYLDITRQTALSTIGMNSIQGGVNIASSYYSNAVKAALDGTATEEQRQAASEVAKVAAAEQLSEAQDKGAQIDLPESAQHVAFEAGLNEGTEQKQSAPAPNRETPREAEARQAETAPEAITQPAAVPAPQAPTPDMTGRETARTAEAQQEAEAAQAALARLQAESEQAAPERQTPTPEQTGRETAREQEAAQLRQEEARRAEEEQTEQTQRVHHTPTPDQTGRGTIKEQLDQMQREREAQRQTQPVLTRQAPTPDMTGRPTTRQQLEEQLQAERQAAEARAEALRRAGTPEEVVQQMLDQNERAQEAQRRTFEAQQELERRQQAIDRAGTDPKAQREEQRRQAEEEKKQRKEEKQRRREEKRKGRAKPARDQEEQQRQEEEERRQQTEQKAAPVRQPPTPDQTNRQTARAQEEQQRQEEEARQSALDRIRNESQETEDGKLDQEISPEVPAETEREDGNRRADEDVTPEVPEETGMNERADEEITSEVPQETNANERADEEITSEIPEETSVNERADEEIASEPPAETPADQRANEEIASEPPAETPADQRANEEIASELPAETPADQKASEEIASEPPAETPQDQKASEEIVSEPPAETPADQKASEEIVSEPPAETANAENAKLEQDLAAEAPKSEQKVNNPFRELQENGRKVAKQMGFAQYSQGSRDTGVQISSWSGTMSADQQAELRIVDDLTRSLGITAVVDSTAAQAGAEGFYNRNEKEGTVLHLMQDGKNPLRVTLGHEAYHMLENLNPQAAATVRSIFEKYAAQSGTSIDNLINEKMETYRKMGIQIKGTDAQIREYFRAEVVADSLYDVIGDAASVRALAVRDRGLVERIRDWVGQMMNRLRKMTDRYASNSREARILRDNIGAMEEARNALILGLGESEALARSRKAAESLGTNGPMLEEYHHSMDSADSRQAMNAATLRLAEKTLKAVGEEATAENVDRLMYAAMAAESGSMPIGEAWKALGYGAWKNDAEANRAFRSLGRYVNDMLSSGDQAGFDQLFGYDAQAQQAADDKWQQDTEEDDAQVRYSISDSAVLDKEYQQAVENGDTKAQKRLVDQVADASGYKTNVDLFHGTQNFGFTEFKEGTIWTTTNEGVAAGYANHGRVRSTNSQYVEDHGDPKLIIRNARNVLGSEYEQVNERNTKEIRDKRLEDFRKANDKLAEPLSKIDQMILPNEMETRFWDVTGLFQYMLDEDERIFESADYAKRMLDESYGALVYPDVVESFDKLRDYYNEHREEIQNSSLKDAFEAMFNGYEVGDALIEYKYSYRKLALGEGDFINKATRSVASEQELKEWINREKGEGVYKGYGKLGDRPLIVDANKAYWLSVKAPELGDGYYSTDQIVKYAKDHGYTSVVIKNVMDPAIVNDYGDDYVFFNSSQFKSSEPVTHDNEGNVIPLSERFSDSSKDIRYSLTPTEDERIQRELEQAILDNDIEKQRELLEQAKKLDEGRDEKLWPDFDGKQEVDAQKALAEFYARQNAESARYQSRRRAEDSADFSAFMDERIADTENQLMLETDMAGGNRTAWNLLETMRDHKMRVTQNADGQTESRKGYWRKDVEAIARKLQDELGPEQKTGDYKKRVSEMFKRLDDYDGDIQGFFNYALKEAQDLTQEIMTEQLRAGYTGGMEDAQWDTKAALREIFKGRYLYVGSEEAQALINTYYGGMREFSKQMSAAGIRVTKNSHTRGVLDLQDYWHEVDPNAVGAREQADNLMRMLGGEENESVTSMIEKLYDAATTIGQDSGVQLSSEEIDAANIVALDTLAEYMQAGDKVVRTRSVEKIDSEHHQETVRERDELRAQTQRQETELQDKEREIGRLEDKMETLERVNLTNVKRMQEQRAEMARIREEGVNAQELKDAQQKFVELTQEHNQNLKELKKTQKALETARQKATDLRAQAREALAKETMAERRADVANRRAERLMEQKARLEQEYREKYKTRMEAQRARAERAQKRSKGISDIRKTGMELRRMLEHPDKNKGFIPIDHARDVAELTEALLTNDGRKSAAKISRHLQNVIEEARRSNDYATGSMYQEETAEAMREVSKLLEDKGALRNLTDDEVNIVSTTLKTVAHQMKTASQTIGREQNVALAEEAADGIRIMNRHKQKMTGLGALMRKVVLQHLNPQRFFDMVGHHGNNAITRMGEELSEAQRKREMHQMKMTQYFEPLITGENEKLYDRFTGKNAVWYDTGVQVIDDRGQDTGRTFRMNGGMRAMFSMMWENEKNREAMKAPVTQDGQQLYQLTMPDEELMKKGKDKEAIAHGERMYFTESQARAIVDELTDYERSWMSAWRAMEKYSKEEINKTSLALFGYHKATEDNYVPIFRDPAYIGKDFDSVVMDNRLTSMGFLKERVNAHNPVMLLDLNNVVDRQITNVADFCGLAIAVRNATRIYNSSMQGYATSFKQTMNQTQGTEVTRYFEKMMGDIQGMNRTESGVLDKLRSNLAGAALTFSPTVTVKQAASYPAAASVIGWKPLMQAFKYFNPVEYRKINESTEIHPYSAGFWLRGSNSRADLEANAARSRLGKTAHWLGNTIQGMDKVTTKVLFKACEYYVRDNRTDLKAGTEAFRQEVARVYDQVLEETQPEYGVMQRPGVLRSNSNLTKSLTMFKTQSFQNFGILADAVTGFMDARQAAREMNSEENQAAVKQAQTKLANAVSSQIASAVILGVMTALGKALMHKMRGYRDDKGDLTAESVGAQIMRDSASSVAGMVVGGSELFDLVSGLIQGQSPFDIEAAGISTVNDLYQNTYSLLSAAQVLADKDLTDQEKLERFWPKLRKMGLSVAQLFGFPAGNIMNLVDGIAANAADFVKGTPGQFVQPSPIQINGMPIIGNAQGRETSNKAVAGYIAQAMMDGNQAEAVRLYNEQLRQGKSADSLNTAIATWQKENIPEIREAAEAIEWGDLDEYNSLINELTGMGLSMSNAVKYVEAERAKMQKEGDDSKGAGGIQYYSYDEIVAGMTKNESNLQYTNGQMNSLLEFGDIEQAKIIRDEMIKAGKKSSSIKSSLTNHWKPQLQDAYDRGDMEEVRRITDMLVQMGMKRETISGWTKENSSSKSTTTYSFGKTSFGAKGFSSTKNNYTSSKYKKSTKSSSSFGKKGTFGSKGFGK